MNYDKISSALLKCFDTLKDDEESKDILEIIDSAESDIQIKEGLRKSIARMKITHPIIAEEVEKDVVGFI